MPVAYCLSSKGVREYGWSEISPGRGSHWLICAVEAGGHSVRRLSLCNSDSPIYRCVYMKELLWTWKNWYIFTYLKAFGEQEFLCFICLSKSQFIDYISTLTFILYSVPLFRACVRSTSASARAGSNADHLHTSRASAMNNKQEPVRAIWANSKQRLVIDCHCILSLFFTHVQKVLF